ncbi:TIGR02281 family clan AA aspartic protease [Haliea sp.]
MANACNRARTAPRIRAIFLLLLANTLLLSPAAQAQAASVTVEALLPNTAVLMINGQRKTLKAGDSFQGVKLLSADAAAAVLEINGERQRLGLNRNITTNFVAPERRQLDIPRNDRMQYITSAQINGRSIQVMVDTGANVVAMSARQASALGVDYRAGMPSKLETASATIDAWMVTLRSVEVGGIRVENVRATVTAGEYPSTVLLGMSYLQHVELREREGVLSLSRAW